MPIVLYFRPVSNGETHPAKDFEKLVYCLGYDMSFANFGTYARQCNVHNWAGFWLTLQQAMFQLFEAFGDLFFDFVSELPGFWFLFGGERADSAQHISNLAFAGEILYAELLEVSKVLHFFQGLDCLGTDFFKLFKHSSSLDSRYSSLVEKNKSKYTSIVVPAQALGLADRRAGIYLLKSWIPHRVRNDSLTSFFSTVASRTRCPCYNLSDCSLCGVHYGIKTGRVGYGDFAEHFSIDGDFRLLTAVDKPAVAQASLPAGGAQTCNPQCPEIPFAEFTADAGINSCSYECFLCKPVLFSGSPSMTLYSFQDSFLRLASCSSFSNPWHISFP